MSKYITSNKEVNKLLRKLTAKGWQLERSKKSLRVYSPDGVYRFSTALTPSDYRVVYNVRQDIKRSEELYEANARENTNVTQQDKGVDAAIHIPKCELPMGSTGSLDGRGVYTTGDQSAESSSTCRGSENIGGRMASVRHYYVILDPNGEIVVHGNREFDSAGHEQDTDHRSHATAAVTTRLGLRFGDKRLVLEPDKDDKISWQIFIAGEKDFYLGLTLTYHTSPETRSLPQWGGVKEERRAKLVQKWYEKYGYDAISKFSEFYEPEPEFKIEIPSLITVPAPPPITHTPAFEPTFSPQVAETPPAGTRRELAKFGFSIHETEEGMIDVHMLMSPQIAGFLKKYILDEGTQGI